MKNIIFILLITPVLSACLHNNFEEHYKPNENSSANIIAPTKYQQPKIIKVKTEAFQEKQNNLYLEGYEVIGSSSFNGEREKNNLHVRNQGLKVGATLILVTNQYTNTDKSQQSHFVPVSKTTRHNGKLYGSNGSSATYNGTSTTSSIEKYTTETIKHKYNYTAIYYAKLAEKRKIVGLRLSDLSDQQRKSNQRNTGAIVTNVIKKTPAFYANIIEGDVIVSINSQKVIDAKQGLSLLNTAKKSNKIRLDVLRNGVEKKFTLTPTH